VNRDVPLDVLLVRHAIAEEQDFARWPDDGDRPLTREGIRRFEPVARRLGVLLPEVDRLLTSPLRRARQTADILARETAWPPAVEEAALAGGGDSFGVIGLLGELHRAGSGRVVLVGHEPDLSELVATSLTGQPDLPIVEMKKGGAALLRFSHAPRAGTGLLRWLLPPRVVLAG